VLKTTEVEHGNPSSSLITAVLRGGGGGGDMSWTYRGGNGCVAVVVVACPGCLVVVVYDTLIKSILYMYNIIINISFDLKLIEILPYR
jgi:hypothetical protein